MSLRRLALVLTAGSRSSDRREIEDRKDYRSEGLSGGKGRRRMTRAHPKKPQPCQTALDEPQLQNGAGRGKE